MRHAVVGALLPRGQRHLTIAKEALVRNMPPFFLALVVLSFANEAGSVQQTDDACIDLNFRAAALQGSDDACILLSAIVGSGGGGILAGDAADVDASCSARNIPEEDEEEGGDGAVANNRTTTRDCVNDVMEVVDGIAREGCEITGG